MVIIAFVRGVIFLSVSWTSMSKVSVATSAKTGVPPWNTTASGSGHKSDGRHDDFVPRPDARGKRGSMEGRRAVTHRHRFPGVDKGRHCPSNRATLGPVVSQSDCNTSQDRGDIVLSQPLAGIGQHIPSHRRAAVDSQLFVRVFHI